MARYYQTADREYLEDGIYMPPVELTSKVIAAKDAELDKDIADINIIKDVAGTNIKYWADVDKEQAEALKNEYNTDVNNLTQYIMENPLSKDIKGRINDLQTRINLDLQQGGRIDALAQNLAAYQKATEAFGKLKDQDYAQATLNYDLQNYKYEKGDTPTAEGNYFNPSKYANPVENVDMFSEVAKVVKDIVPKETGGYYSKKTGEKIMTETGQRTKQRIEDVTLEALMNAAPEWRAKMLNDDKIGWNGSGNTWYIYDENGNPIGINKDSDVVKNLIKQEQDVYFKDDKKVKSEIIDEDLFERHYGITKGRKPTDENHYYVAANFISDSDLYRNAASNAYRAYIADKGTPLVIRDDNGHYTGCVMGTDGRIWKISKDERGNTIHDSDGKIVKKPLSDKEWENFGDRFYEARTKENNNNYKSESNKYLGEYYNDEIMNISADKTTFEKVKAAIDIAYSHSSGVYSAVSYRRDE
ncbi:MAG: hypothetical protein J5701_06470 [Bacteroidales bacterium]|nr:hypothetical protein [Bacteroidales bacterium]